ncbi:MAG: hypothetical protein HZA08_11090, partial [Nitrospirae bacterium]|nr:hypothetical protein [Nitrospirota bacterium]
ASRTPESGASLTSITLTTNYAGTSGASLGYQITKDFTPYRGYPEIAQGDADAADWITKALRMIDSDLGTGGGGIFARKANNETITGGWTFAPTGSDYTLFKGANISNIGQVKILGVGTNVEPRISFYDSNNVLRGTIGDNGSEFFIAAISGRNIRLGYDAAGITVTSSGNVGIGTSAPTLPLTIKTSGDHLRWQNSSEAEMGRLGTENNGANGWISLFNSSGVQKIIIHGTGQFESTTGDGLAPFKVNVNSTTTTATAGSQTLPSNPAGFLKIGIGGTTYKLPYYNA